MLALIEFGQGARSDFSCRSVRGSLHTHDTTCVSTPPTRSSTFSGPGRADSEHSAGKPHFQPPRPAGPAELQRPGEREQDPERQARRRVGCSSQEWAPRAGEPACLAGFPPPRGSGGPETRQQTPLPPPSSRPPPFGPHAPRATPPRAATYVTAGGKGSWAVGASSQPCRSARAQASRQAAAIFAIEDRAPLGEASAGLGAAGGERQAAAAAGGEPRGRSTASGPLRAEPETRVERTDPLALGVFGAPRLCRHQGRVCRSPASPPVGARARSPALTLLSLRPDSVPGGPRRRRGGARARAGAAMGAGRGCGAPWWRGAQRLRLASGAAPWEGWEAAGLGGDGPPSAALLSLTRPVGNSPATPDPSRRRRAPRCAPRGARAGPLLEQPQAVRAPAPLLGPRLSLPRLFLSRPGAFPHPFFLPPQPAWESGRCDLITDALQGGGWVAAWECSLAGDARAQERAKFAALLWARPRVGGAGARPDPAGLDGSHLARR